MHPGTGPGDTKKKPAQLRPWILEKNLPRHRHRPRPFPGGVKKDKTGSRKITLTARSQEPEGRVMEILSLHHFMCCVK